jgi:zinc protease
LQKAKNAMLIEFYHQMKTIDGKSRALGSYEVFFGDHRKLFTAGEAVNQVTLDDLKRVAQKYFSENNRTVATLVPDKTPREPAASPAKP